MEKITGLALSAVYNKYMLWLFYVQTYRVQELKLWPEESFPHPPPPARTWLQNWFSPLAGAHELLPASFQSRWKRARTSLRWLKCNQFWQQRREKKEGNGHGPPSHRWVTVVCWAPAFLGTSSVGQWGASQWDERLPLRLPRRSVQSYTWKTPGGAENCSATETVHAWQGCDLWPPIWTHIH